MVTKVRYYIFLKDVLKIALGAFGGPQAHMTYFLRLLVEKRGYLTEKELMELYALCQILPGPTSTQTLTAIGFRIGGPNLAYLTLLVWMTPAVTIMTTAAILVSHFQSKHEALEFTHFIQPMAVGFVAYAAYKISTKVVTTRTGFVIMILAAILSFLFRSPFVFPVILLLSGGFTSWKYKRHDIEEKQKIKIEWANFVLWAGVFIFAALLGAFTQYLPIRLFENFYRNGSLIFGGGQVLIPFLYTEFVEFKDYLTSEEFLSGFAMVQAVPGPTFSFCAYVGAISMKEYGLLGEIAGGFVAAFGVFLPGTFLIYFVIRFWEAMKKYRVVKASLEGITAASSGLVIAAVFILFEPLDFNVVNTAFGVVTALILRYTRISPPYLILVGIGLGLLYANGYLAFLYSL